MSLQTRLSALISAIGSDVKSLRDDVDDLQPTDVGFIVATYPTSVPGGTPDGTIMIEYIP